ncbi:MAG: sigma-70 family RNA polymerase sigma factor [Cyclobacteriaceae bacterium]|nr:sigma-70 family RNA polymerase sigma factor [Cyclobacteriaceae bacterium]
MTPINHIDEKGLLQQLRDGDQLAFSKLYQIHAKTIYRRLQRMVNDTEQADELLQELFIKVWEKRNQITINESFGGYLHAIAYRMSIDYFRSLELKERVHKEVFTYVDYEVNSTVEQIDFKETQELIDKAVSDLPEQRRKAFTLCKLEGKSYEEAAQIMNLSPHTIHNHIVKAVKSVKAHLERSGKDVAILSLLVMLSSSNY